MTLSKGPTTLKYAKSGKMAQVANFLGDILLKDTRLSKFWTLYLKCTSYHLCGAKNVRERASIDWRGKGVHNPGVEWGIGECEMRVWEKREEGCSRGIPGYNPVGIA
jgi:hypothetical protein